MPENIHGTDRFKFNKRSGIFKATDGRYYSIYELPEGKELIVEGDLDLSRLNIDKLPDLSRLIVKGDFNCSGCYNLTTLNGKKELVGSTIKGKKNLGFLNFLKYQTAALYQEMKNLVSFQKEPETEPIQSPEAANKQAQHLNVNETGLKEFGAKKEEKGASADLTSDSLIQLKEKHATAVKKYDILKNALAYMNQRKVVNKEKSIKLKERKEGQNQSLAEKKERIQAHIIENRLHSKDR